MRSNLTSVFSKPLFKAETHFFFKNFEANLLTLHKELSMLVLASEDKVYLVDSIIMRTMSFLKIIFGFLLVIQSQGGYASNAFEEDFINPSDFPSGTIKYKIKPGQRFKKDDLILIIEAMKMEFFIHARETGGIMTSFIIPDRGFIKPKTALFKYRPANEDEGIPDNSFFNDENDGPPSPPSSGMDHFNLNGPQVPPIVFSMEPHLALISKEAPNQWDKVISTYKLNATKSGPNVFCLVNSEDCILNSSPSLNEETLNINETEGMVCVAEKTSLFTEPSSLGVQYKREIEETGTKVSSIVTHKLPQERKEEPFLLSRSQQLVKKALQTLVSPEITFLASLILLINSFPYFFSELTFLFRRK